MIIRIIHWNIGGKRPACYPASRVRSAEHATTTNVRAIVNCSKCRRLFP